MAWFGARDAARVLVTISGTHGVEGYCGSGAQLDWMLRGEQARVPAGTAVLMIHAINPYGFAWNRRVTHENVDLNRNWIDFDGGTNGHKRRVRRGCWTMRGNTARRRCNRP